MPPNPASVIFLRNAFARAMLSRSSTEPISPCTPKSPRFGPLSASHSFAMAPYSSTAMSDGISVIVTVCLPPDRPGLDLLERDVLVDARILRELEDALADDVEQDLVRAACDLPRTGREQLLSPAAT